MAYDRDSDSAKPDQASRDLERNMRRTLGFGAPGAGHRRRFAQDGDVPVVVVRGRRDDNREVSEAGAQPQRDLRDQAERSLAAAQATVRDLQTKLAHIEMSQTELRESFDRIRGEKQTIEVALQAEISARRDAEERLEKEVAARQALEARVRAPSRPTASSDHISKPRSARVTPAPIKQQPVNWWSKRAKK